MNSIIVGEVLREVVKTIERVNNLRLLFKVYILIKVGCKICISIIVA